MWSPKLSFSACEYYALLAMRCCLGAVGRTCQAGLYWEVPSLRSLFLRWQQQSSSAAPIVCYGRLSSAARVVPGEQQCRFGRAGFRRCRFGASWRAGQGRWCSTSEQGVPSSRIGSACSPLFIERDGWEGFTVVIGGARGWNTCDVRRGSLSLFGLGGPQLLIECGFRVTGVTAVICFNFPPAI